MSHAHSSSAANLVGVHYRVGKKIGEGSFGVIFEGMPHFSAGLAAAHLTFICPGTNLLNSQTVAIKFVRSYATAGCIINNSYWSS
jgi:casein kinase 1